jgi:hypothetical protein
VYARAAASVVGMDRWSDESWNTTQFSYKMKEKENNIKNNNNNSNKLRKFGSFL